MKWSFTLFILLWSFAAFSQSLLTTAENLYFNPLTANRVGLEVEMAGLSVDEVAHTAQQSLKGSIQVHRKIESHVDQRTGRLEHFRVIEKELVDSRIGSLAIKPEDNSTDNSNLKTAFANTQIVELVTAPITFDKVILFQNSLDKIKANGAIGTEMGFPISIQVNVEMGEGDKEKIRVDDVLNILRNYLKPFHRKQIADELNVPQFRKKYLGLYTPGMMERILDPDYSPSWEVFFLDFMYRQSLEVLGHDRAWTLPESEVRERLKMELEVKGFEVILPVIKWNYVRASSLFMFMFPDDWLTKFLEETTWFHRYPILEFREPNNDFNVLGTTKKILGLVQRSLEVGEFTYVGNLPTPSESLCWRLLRGYSVRP